MKVVYFVLRGWSPSSQDRFLTGRQSNTTAVQQLSSLITFVYKIVSGAFRRKKKRNSTTTLPKNKKGRDGDADHIRCILTRAKSGVVAFENVKENKQTTQTNKQTREKQ